MVEEKLKEKPEEPKRQPTLFDSPRAMLRMTTLVSGPVAGIGLVMIAAILGLASDVPDGYLRVAIVLFAISIPISLLAFVLPTVSRLVLAPYFLTTVGFVATMVGVYFVFVHLFASAAYIFIWVTLACFIFCCVCAIYYRNPDLDK